MPLTLSVSSVMAVTSARLFWVSVLMPRRILPTRCVSHRKNGSTASDSSVSCQLEPGHRDERDDDRDEVAEDASWRCR